MPARTIVGGSLVVTLANNGEEIDSQTAVTPADAARVAAMLIASRGKLNHGDCLTVRHVRSLQRPQGGEG
jgi:uncharacterized protein YrrD